MNISLKISRYFFLILILLGSSALVFYHPDKAISAVDPQPSGWTIEIQSTWVQHLNFETDRVFIRWFANSPSGQWAAVRTKIDNQDCTNSVAVNGFNNYSLTISCDRPHAMAHLSEAILSSVNGVEAAAEAEAVHPPLGGGA